MDANNKERRKYWAHWQAYAIGCNVDPWFRHTSIEDRGVALTAFAERVRSGYYGKQRRVGAQTVQIALRAVGTTFQLAGRTNPIWRSEGRYLLPIERQIERFKREDPPPKRQLAVPVTVPESLVQLSQVTKNPRDMAIADLSTIAFYYLLRVGEYTHPAPRANKRTTPFRIKDITFWSHNNTVIPHTAPLHQLLQAKSATLCISNQKNGVRGSIINHEANGTISCPIRALARRVHHILSHSRSPDAILGTYFDAKGYKHKIYPDAINKALKEAVTNLGLVARGFPTSAISSHSLRAGGATAMHINGATDLQIRKQGRWSSDTFLMYIHEQISAFSQGLSTKMSTHITGWRNIAGPTLVEPAH